MILNLYEAAQSREEIHLLHAKLLAGRFNALRGLLLNLTKLSEVPPSEEKEQIFGELVQLLESDPVPAEHDKLIARIESQHEAQQYFLSKLKAEISRWS